MGTKVHGPYRHGAGYRCSFRREGKTCVTETVLTYEEALRLKRALELELAKLETLSIAEALEQYRAYLTMKGNKPASVTATLARIGHFFEKLDASLGSLTPRSCENRYHELTTEKRKGIDRPLSVDSHRNYLAEARSFLAWCTTRGLMESNPLQAVRGIGRRRRGKAQLGIDEARTLSHKALELATAGDVGALCVLVLLYLGFRANELVNLRARDVDDGGRILWVRDAIDAKESHLKTRAAKRGAKVPEFLRSLLVAQAGRALSSRDFLFGLHWRDWPRKQVERLCELAEVPRVNAHGLRGMRATLALISGEDPELVARTLGHASIRMTIDTYAAPGTKEALEQRRLEEALKNPEAPK